MSSPSLNEDVLALIVKEVARQAEASAPAALPGYARPTLEQWRRRSEALRRLALVSQIFRPLAQTELSRFVYINSRNHLYVVHAPRLDLRLARRVVFSQSSLGGPATSVGLLEQCEEMEELLVLGGPFSLCSIARPTHRALRKLTLRSAETFAATPETTSRFHLTSLELHTSGNLRPDDWRVLGLAGAATIQHLRLVYLSVQRDSRDEATTALATWIPSLVSLYANDQLAQYGLNDVILSNLPSATNLQSLHIPLDYVIRALAALPTTDGATGLVALGVDEPCDEDEVLIDESYLALLNSLGRFPIDGLKTFAYPKAHQTENSVPLYEVVSALGMRGVEVIHGPLPEYGEE
ncbi:hypothetical protein BCR35DRAFT_348889 [Leucosporidium creatinivorum]|uniref:Uncharacterized protein n=1 Tax=Leucosporidium creatinivorum TaxID=106004 RepID=A0A1Y2G4Q0_9BASI|nr:hypothetical protein BCR35DRAFT_348889 [Leucosporidium creatinivorum]